MSDRIGVMSAGKLQQVGSPRDIYTKPVNRLVASFIGETNFLPATRTNAGLTLAGGHRLDAPQGGTIGETVTLTVRPEQVRLAGADDPCAIPARVTSLVYFGTDTHCYMALDGGAEVIARLQSSATGDADLAIGSAVGVTFAPNSTQILGD